MSHLKVYYQPNGGISAVPDIQDICQLFVFNCASPDAYYPEKVFYRTKNASHIFLEEVSTYDPDVIIIETLNSEMFQTLIKLRRSYKKPVVLFWGDLLNQNSYPLLKRFASYLDLVLVLDRNSESRLVKLGLPVKYIVNPASGRLYHTDPLQEKIYNYVFAGNFSFSSQWYYRTSAIKFRYELVKAFAEKPGFALFGGDSWRNYGINVLGWVDENQLSKIYNQTKIVLASDQILDAEGFSSNRTTKVLMSGSFLLIKKFKGIEALFQNHGQLVWFDSVPEAVELADYYLEHDDEREQIALAGMTWAKEHADLRKHFDIWCHTDLARSYSTNILKDFLDYLWMGGYLLRRIIVRIAGQLGLRSPEWFWLVD
jgi:hypothetical protein